VSLASLKKRRMIKIFLKCLVGRAFLLLAVCCSVSPVIAQLNQNCTVSVLNRNVQVNTDGTWVLSNILVHGGKKNIGMQLRNG